jgi:hypothetical protein
MNELELQKTMFQRFMSTFISNLPETLQSTAVIEANGLTLQTNVQLNDGREINVSGHTDVFICNPTEQDSNGQNPVPAFYRLMFLVELKLPNSSLNRCDVYQARDQTLMETEMVARMQARHRSLAAQATETISTVEFETIVKSCYTDMYAISISIRIPQHLVPSATTRIYLVESRLVDPDKYIKRLLLLFCNLDANDILRLMNKSDFDKEKC